MKLNDLLAHLAEHGIEPTPAGRMALSADETGDIGLYIETGGHDIDWAGLEQAVDDVLDAVAVLDPLETAASARDRADASPPSPADVAKLRNALARLADTRAAVLDQQAGNRLRIAHRIPLPEA